MSAKITTVAFEGELNSIVREYLEFGDYVLTLEKFEDECTDRGKPIAVIGNEVKSNEKLLRIQREMMTHLDAGNRRSFQQLWLENLPQNIRDEDPIAQRLQFYVNIYFATYPVREGREKYECEEAMQIFKKYIESTGATLSQTTEFLPFYALPFVPNPKSHPTYRDIFTETWVEDLKMRTAKFLALAFQSSPQPKLFELYTTCGGSDDLQNRLRTLQQQVYESEKRVMTSMRRNNKVQADYHNLIGITAELVDALENTVNGQLITPEYLQQICTRLFSSQTKFSTQSVDLSRPGTAASMLRASVAPKRSVPNRTAVTTAPLDYDKIKKDLAGGDERQIAFLLQALRWRLTKSPPEQRDSIISGFIANDILGCTHNDQHRKTVLKLLESENEVNRQYTARLFNAMASVNSGRNYLAANRDLLKSLIHCLKSEQKDSIGLENVLGCLQKLSLKRTLQSTMIKDDIISWLVQVLEDHDSLSDYTLEYSIALLMNLCLRTLGKKECVPIAGKTLKMLTDLLGHDTQEILPYVNGTLYSILAIPSIREEAKTMDMEDMLQCFIKDGQPDMNRQLKFIVKQLNSNDEPDEVESDDEDDEDEDDDQDSMEADLDKAEVLKSQMDELIGEEFLVANYSAPPPTAGGRRGKKQLTSEMPLNRPVTPARRGDISRNDDRLSDSAQMPPPIQRPPTRTGSRPGTAQSTESNGVAKEKTEDPAVVARRQLQQADPTYKAAFYSRPKIPRTPELGGARGSTRASLTDATPLPQYSDGLPRSRPSSAGGSRTNGTNLNRSPPLTNQSRPTSRGQSGR